MCGSASASALAASSTLPTAAGKTGGITYEYGPGAPSHSWSAEALALATAATYRTATQAAQELGYSSASTVRKAMHDGKLRHVTIGPPTVLTTRDWVTALQAQHDGRGPSPGKPRP